MQARLPQIDFSGADVLWIPALPAFAHQMNGASLLLPYLEPYLIKVMKAARPSVAERAPELLGDLDDFNRQEANHYRVHARYNAVMREQYPGLEAFEREIRADFERFLAKRPLAWNLAYSEGFESVGVIQAELFLQEIGDVLDSGDPAVTELWRWHLAEEFEHRNVAHDVLEALHPGWLRRLNGLQICARHLFGFAGRVRDHMLAVDRARGRVRDDDAERAAARRFARRQTRFQGPRLAKVLMPGYSPRSRPMDEATRRVLASYEV